MSTYHLDLFITELFFLQANYSNARTTTRHRHRSQFESPHGLGHRGTEQVQGDKGAHIQSVQAGPVAKSGRLPQASAQALGR